MLDFAAFIKVSAWESNFLPARKLRTEAAEASAASEALLVIINTKSFQKQQQPQFPKEKKKELEHQNYDQFWTQQSSSTIRRINTKTRPVRPVRKLPLAPHWSLPPAFKMAACFPFIWLVGLNWRLVTSRGRARECVPRHHRYIRLRSFEVMNSPWYIYSTIL